MTDGANIAVYRVLARATVGQRPAIATGRLECEFPYLS